MLAKRLTELPDQYKVWFRLDYHNECMEIRIDDISYTPKKSSVRYLDMSDGMPSGYDVVLMIDHMIRLMNTPVSNYDEP